jgi:hypothetical protein
VGPDEGDEVQSTQGAQSVLALGAEVEIRQGVAKDRVVSVGDPEMRHGHNSRNRTWDGYKGHVSVGAEGEFITAVQVTQANVHDGAAAPALMEAHERVGFKPEAYVGDMAYSPAELRGAGGGVRDGAGGPVPPASAPAGCYSKDEFSVDLKAGNITCPAGATTRRASGGATNCGSRISCTVEVSVRQVTAEPRRPSSRPSRPLWCSTSCGWRP